MGHLDSRVLDRLVVLGSLLPKWDAEVKALAAAADRAADTAVVELNWVTRAGELLQEIGRERRTLEELVLMVQDPLLDDVVRSLIDRLGYLIEDVEDLSRQMHGCTR